MSKVYVLTNETNENMVIGVYSTMTNATNAMLTYAHGWAIIDVEPQKIGTQYTFYRDDCCPMKLYIERCVVDDDVYLPAKVPSIDEE